MTTVITPNLSTKPRILVVDDNPIFAEIFRRLFDLWGYEVVIGGCSDKAVAMLPHVNPDIVTTDIRNPPLDGQGVIDAVRQFNPHIPVIVISGFTETDCRDYAPNAAACFSKDSDMERLEQVLRAVAEGVGKQPCCESPPH